MKILSLVLFLVVGKCKATGMQDSFLTIDMNDILDEKFMPASFLMLQGSEELSMESRLEPKQKRILNSLFNVTQDDGTFGTAFSTMGFHRKMINKYRCNGFLAKQLISEIIPVTLSISKRFGTSPTMSENSSQTSKDAMLFDQGSSGYKDWLSKSTTLEDIHRNYLSPSTSPSNTTNHANHRSDSFQPSNPRVSDEDEYFDEGVITGYAIQQPDPQQPINHAYPNYHTMGYNPYQFGAHHRLSYAPKLYQHPRSDQLHPSRASHQQELLKGEAPQNAARGDYSYHPAIEIEEKGIGKGLDLKDLFDIALTTLAFLSFGMFILQVIMCVTMTSNDANMMVIPMEGDIDGGGETEVRRKRTVRSIPSIEGARRREINEIARKVLDSMDAAVFAREDNGECVQSVICESSGLSRDLKYTKSYWVSVWNLGVSWLTGNMVGKDASSGSIMGCLRAMVIGLGGGRCNEAYNCRKNHQQKTRKSIA
ncbi:uncharacterized protein LOC129778920 [Toxorhynchites rutilus septentrionalis]|uniref:uncharacterized protein LOC129778920 n=1 Tax=Toxorhynchites rutilus septentrionalis TaxID=329112 RepID=UPI00247A65A2|nr:uncharacterized protein LOC129778920 [Toxorhynchites rutilus septentrionalis]